MRFRQGDTYELEAALENTDGTALEISDISKVEFVIGPVRKVYPGDATYETDKFIIPLTQAETFQLADKGVPRQVRVLFTNGSVVGSDIIWDAVDISLSKEVLT